MSTTIRLARIICVSELRMHGKATQERVDVACEPIGLEGRRDSRALILICECVTDKVFL
jgi:hypothetical protein